jgi:hypothetical protein
VTPILIIHIAAGGIGIATGAAALAVRKGEPAHRALGTLFCVAMLIMAALGVMLAAMLSEGTLLPKNATIVVGVFTLDLVASAWMTVRRKPGDVGAFEAFGCLVALGAAIVLLTFGLRAPYDSAPAHRHASPAPYFVFAALAAFTAALDLNMILQCGVVGAQRIARHLWRMCLALFFATSFFFLGQQKVMPAALHGSPILLALGRAPLPAMVFWLARVGRPTRSKADAMRIATSPSST